MNRQHWEQEADWRDDAACLGADPALFFPTPGAHTTLDFSAARAICSTCPVWVPCFDYAMTDPDAALWGMWGGHTPTERAKVRRLLEVAPPTLQGVLL